MLILGATLIAINIALACFLERLMSRREKNRGRHTEAQLHGAAAVQSAILNSANYAIISAAVDGTVTTFNATAERLLGYAAAEVVGKVTPAIWHEPDEVLARAQALSRESKRKVVPGFGSIVAKAAQGRTDENEWVLIRKDGSRFWGWLSVTALTDATGGITGYVGVLTDITERKQQEAALRLSEERFRRAFDDAPIGMCLVSPVGRLLKVNRALGSILGYPESELLQMDFQTITHPDDLQSDLALVRKVLSAELPSYQLEKRYLHRDGSIVFANLSVSLVRDRDGIPLYFVSQIENISHRLEMDRIKREFISTVSHELRTPLTSIRGSLGLLDAGVLGSLPEKAAAMVAIAHQNSERLMHIINDILDIEKIESGRLELLLGDVPIASCLKHTLEVNQGYGEKYQVNFVLEGAPPEVEVRADENRLMQVLANLLSNAAKFSAPNGNVQVRATLENRSVRIEVEDHGMGIPEEFRQRIFEKFAQADSSSARRVDGTGLGLSITRQLVEAMGGTIGFTTTSGVGTTFYFNLPRVETQMQIPLGEPMQDARHRVA